MADDRDGAGTEKSATTEDLAHELARKVVGQPNALKHITPYIETYRAGLSPDGRPVGIFLLLGPTGTGKTRTVEALAEVLHGDAKRVLKIDCGEFQSEHEVAKLIGAPPGYVGHRESQPRLTQRKIEQVTSDRSDLALILFDEVEKAAPAMTTLLLGILDKGTLSLGDGSQVNFEKTLIFMTSNLGAREMRQAVEPTMGFGTGRATSPVDLSSDLANIGLAAVRKQYSPEFINRLDVIITYEPLSADALAMILDQHILDLQRHVKSRLGDRSFTIDVSQSAREFLARKGTSAEYGARELTRTLHRFLTQPIAAKVAAGEAPPRCEVRVEADEDGASLSIQVIGAAVPAAPPSRILVVDDNPGVLRWLESVLTRAGYEVQCADTLEKATHLARRAPDAALLDYLLPDGDGLTLAVDLSARSPRVPVALMTGMSLPLDEAMVCQSTGIPVLHKPFRDADVLGLIEQRLLVPASKEQAAGR